MTPRLLLIAASLLALTSAAHAEPLPGRDMTCDGPYRGERVGYCHLEDDVISKIVPGIPPVDKVVGVEKVEKACKDYRRCIIRARVIPRGEPVEGHQNWTVLKVYSARMPRRR